MLCLKNLPESGAAVAAGSIICAASEASQSSGPSLGGEKMSGPPAKPSYTLYCMAGHKTYVARLPNYGLREEVRRVI